MARFVCSQCGQEDETGWTYYYTYVAMGIPPRCAQCDPTQRSHFHAQAESDAKKEEEPVFLP